MHAPYHLYILAHRAHGRHPGAMFTTPDGQGLESITRQVVAGELRWADLPNEWTWRPDDRDPWSLRVSLSVGGHFVQTVCHEGEATLPHQGIHKGSELLETFAQMVRNRRSRLNR